MKINTFLNLSEGPTNVAEYFPTIYEDYRRFPKTSEKDLKISRSRRTKEFKYNSKDKLDISEVTNLLTCEDI